MRRHALDLAVLFLIATLACVYVMLAAPGIRSEVLHAYVLVVGGLVMLGLVTTAGESQPLERRGLALAPEHLGQWWPLLRPDRPPPEDHFGSSISEAELRALVDALERI